MDKILFVGGYQGVGKDSGKPYYVLKFVYTPAADDMKNGEFGADNPTCFVKEKVFNDFKNIKPMTSFNGTMFRQAGKSYLVNYNL